MSSTSDNSLNQQDPQTGDWQANPEGPGATVDVPPAPPEAADGGQTVDRVPVPEEPGETLDAPPAPPPVEAPVGGATGAWQPGPEEPGATVDVPVSPPGTTPNGPGPEDGATTDFGPARGGAGGTSAFLPGRESSGDSLGSLSRGSLSTGGRSSRSLSRQVLVTQQRQADVTGAAPGGAAQAPELSPGRYVLKNFHAKGGMGEIWLADDQDVGRSVALKKMRANTTPEQKDQFLREAQITGQLEHPGVVPVHELSEDQNGEPFYVMKFIQGRTLTDAIVEYHTPPKPDGVPREVQGLRLLQTFLYLCQTVAFAHSKKIIHRDLKPDNVMVGAYGETLLLDWGLAKPVGQADTPGMPGYVRYSYSGESLTTLDGSIKGTPSYMSPEVAEGKVTEVDESNDIYLLGGTLYHILTGKKPREAKKVSELIRMARLDPPVPPRKHDRAIPRPLEAICLKALAHRKEDRYPSAQALAEDVQRYLAGEPVSAYRENLWERTLRWVKRHRVALGRAAVAALVLVLVLFGANEIRKAEDRAELARKENERHLKAEADKRARAERQARELKNQKKAAADVQAFDQAADEARRLFALQDPSAENLLSPGADRAEQQAEKALALLHPWGAGLEGLPLPAGQRGLLKQQLYEMYLLLAETKTRRGTRPEAARPALALLDRAAALRTPTAAFRRLQSECYELLGDQTRAAEARHLAEAETTPTTALDLYLTAERLRVGHARATAGRDRSNWTRGQQKRLERAVETYRQAIALDYNQFWAHFQLGQCYLVQRKEDLALNALDACVAVRPESPWGYTLRGHALALLRRFDGARADLERAMKFGPGLREPRLERGVVNWLQKRYDAALADFDAVLEPPPERRLIEAAFYRGQLRLERGDEDQALDDFTLVIKERPWGHPASLRRARIYFARGDVKRGLADLDAFLGVGKSLPADSAAAYYERGRRLRLMLPELPRAVQKAHLRLALKQLREAVRGGLASAAVYDELGTALELSGKAPEAVAAYTEAVKREPKEARLLVKRGWAYAGLNQYDKAGADFAAALRLDPKHAEALAGLGYVEACQGKTAGGPSSHAVEAALYGAGDYLVLHNVACVYGKLSERDPKRAREYQDLALVCLRREVELWRRDRTGPDPVVLIRNEPAFPQALKDRPEFQKLVAGEP